MVSHFLLFCFLNTYHWMIFNIFPKTLCLILILLREKLWFLYWDKWRYDQDLNISLDYANYRLQPFADPCLTQDLKIAMKFQVQIVQLIKLVQIRSNSSTSYQILFSDAFPVLVPYASDKFGCSKYTLNTILITSLSS